MNKNIAEKPCKIIKESDVESKRDERDIAQQIIEAERVIVVIYSYRSHNVYIF